MLTYTQRLEAIQFNFDNIPEKFQDCITLELINDPVYLSDGHVYDRHTALELIARRKVDRISPKTREPLTKDVINAHFFRSELIHFIEAQEALAKPAMLEKRLGELSTSLANKTQACLEAESEIKALKSENINLKKAHSELQQETNELKIERNNLRAELKAHRDKAEKPSSGFFGFLWSSSHQRQEAELLMPAQAKKRKKSKESC